MDHLGATEKQQTTERERRREEGDGRLKTEDNTRWSFLTFFFHKEKYGPLLLSQSVKDGKWAHPKGPKKDASRRREEAEEGEERGSGTNELNGCFWMREIEGDRG